MNKQEKRYKMLPDGDLYRIRALIDFTNPANGVEVKAGELGGLIEKESNLSQLGNGWVHLGSKVTGDAVVEDAFIDGNSHIFDSAHILSGYIDDSTIKGNARIEGFLTIVNSTIENGAYTVLDKTKTGGIENATLRNLYVANSVFIKNSTVEAKEAFHSEKLLYVENSTILMTSGTGVKECAFTDVEITINSFASFQSFGISCFKMNSNGDFTIDEDKSKPESKTVIQGEKENPVEFRGELWLRISDTIIVGSALVEGNLNIVSCRIEGMPVIKMNGSLFTSQISDCAQIDCPLSEVHYMENLIVGEDAVHTVVYF